MYIDANIKAGTICNYLPNLLNTWVSSIQWSINGVNIGIAHSFNLVIAYLMKLLTVDKTVKQDIQEIDLSWADTPGQFDHLENAADESNTNNIANKGLLKKKSNISWRWRTSYHRWYDCSVVKWWKSICPISKRN